MGNRVSFTLTGPLTAPYPVPQLSRLAMYVRTHRARDRDPSIGAKTVAKDAKKKVVKKVMKAASKPVPKAVNKPIAKPAPKAAVKPAAKPVAKAAAKPVVKVGAKPAKVDPKKAVETKAKDAPKGKVAAKPEVKVVAKLPGGKVATKPEVKADGQVGGKKGITVVEAPKMVPKKLKPKSTTLDELPSLAGELLRPGGPSRKPLIPSGPKAPTTTPLGSHALIAEVELPPAKTPFNKTELKHYKEILIAKRAELIGDVTSMEKQALNDGSGALSHQPQHIAEQGSDTYDQTLALEIAAQDRRLVKEIDDALNRIEAGTYGICELSGKAISKHRLEELPWARFSIEAAREQERKSVRPSYSSRHDQ